MLEINFNNLPLAVSQVQEKLARIEQLLLGLGKKDADANDWLDISQLCNYLPDRPTKATVYCWVQAGKIPYHKGSKKLRFHKQEIDQWLQDSAYATIEQIVDEVHNYVLAPKKRRGYAGK